MKDAESTKITLYFVRNYKNKSTNIYFVCSKKPVTTNILLKNANKSIDPLGENAFGHLVVIPF